SLKTSIKTITYLSDIGCLEIQGASLDPKELAISQEMISDYNLYVSMVSTLTRKGVGAVETLLRS
ncbi:type III secretion system inner rod subunit SctI, partial [Salmonella enterica]|nr:type III secretion system inner rod subunit SctI [Salmonella enterica]MCQ8036237.1 type III secretion system inner rod subunit SctI [Salmonella enterica]